MHYVNDYNANGFLTYLTDTILTNPDGYGIRTYYGAIVHYAYNDLWQNTAGATDGNPVDDGNNKAEDPLYNTDYTLESGSPCAGTASDGKDMGVVFTDCGSCGPTLITLSSFNAVSKFNEIIINWATESEIDNAGFNIYRSEAAGGPYTRITGSLIPAEGFSTQGATYEFADDNVWFMKTYYYRLEDIDLNGTSTMHGPVSARPSLFSGLFQ